ncbi:hypothetical protein ISCGN_027561 [Ixodes scapularis]
MHYYNDEKENDHGGRGLTGALVVKFIIMLAIMFIFFFAIIAYAMHKKKQPTDNSNVTNASPVRLNLIRFLPPFRIELSWRRSSIFFLLFFRYTKLRAQQRRSSEESRKRETPN